MNRRPTPYGLLAPRQNEAGQMALMAAGAMIVILGFAALTIDLGFFAHTRREVQNDADAMALASVRELPDEEAAEDIAYEWGDKNDVEASEVEQLTFGVTCDGEAIEGTVTVRLKRKQETFLAGILGIQSGEMHVCATARIGVAAGGTELLPFGLLEDDPEIADVCFFQDAGGSENADFWSNSCLLKIASPNDSWTSGNTGPIRLDEGNADPGNYDAACDMGNSGASEYSENIENGSECKYAVGDRVRTKTGNMKGPTCSAFSSKLSGNSDTIEDVFGEPDANGVYKVLDPSSPRFGIVPIVSVPPGASGSSAEVTITGFVTVFINGACSGAGCTGNGNNPACVVITPVKSSYIVSGAAFGGSDLTDAANAMRTIKLIN